MSFAPIYSLETNLLIAKEELYSQSHINLSNNDIITINNTGNMEREVLMEIILKETFLTGFTITNLTTGVSVEIDDPETNYSSGSIFIIYPDAVYLNNESTEIVATFSAPFIIAEHMINTLQFLLPGNIDATISWMKPNDSKKELIFVQGFSVNENITTQRQNNNKLNKYAKGYLSTQIDYDFNIDKMWLDSDFFADKDQNSRYQIVYQTDTSIDDIIPQTFYLSNCCFNSLGLNQSETEMVKKNIRGNCCRVIKG
jgi:hypothetical protein